MPYKICKHAMHLINQGVSWCDINCDSFPCNCGEKCPKYEEVDLTGTITTTNNKFLKEYLTPIDNRPEGYITLEELKNGKVKPKGNTRRK